MDPYCSICGLARNTSFGCPGHTPSPRPTYEEPVEKLKFAATALRDAGYHHSAADIDSLLTRCRQGGDHEGSKI